ncbi:hypothetical protein D9758_014683 [Tetrapyrgos nigripes]|uniref:Uncharacterized protein n=1 Tax=Tetrapyrgos nigripes TaxID=182062 RepID=A0A8H5FNV3_9AGAR|nr:hypothetical protein D9758_014683 [Tetrapyrgos nigripes]
MRPDSPIPENLQTKEKKRKSIATARANGNDPIDSALPSSKKAKTTGSGNARTSRAKSTAKTVVKAATQKLKNTLSKPKGKQKKTTATSDIESDKDSTDDQQAYTTPTAKSSQAAVIDVDEDSDDEPQPAPHKKSSGPKATGMDVDEDSDDDDGTSSCESEPIQEQTDDAELERLMKGWNSPAYAFFDPTPSIEYINGRKCHVFTCGSPLCKSKVRRFQDTADAKSTKTLATHVKACKGWGPAAFESVQGMKLGDARKAAGRYVKDGNIVTAFKRGKKGTITYSHRAHTSWETRQEQALAEIVRWVAESGRPFAIVKDRGFQCLMKTGRPGYYLPHPTTVARDVKTVFAKTRQRIALMLQEYEGDINFATDAWSSPNHRAYIAITVHLEHDGEPLSFLLDFVEVATSHSGENLAKVFAEILTEFGIEEKILSITADNASSNDTMISALETLLPDFPGELNRTRCFNHIINLVGKSLTKLFDMSSSKKSEDTVDDAEKALMDLAAGVDFEDLQFRLKETEDGEEREKDSEDLVVDMMEGMSAEEKETLRKQIIPVQQVLVKFRKTAFKVINSTTILLPQWRDILKEMKQPQTVIPRDVTTRWNSTCDLIGYCIDKEHKKAYRAITNAEDDNGLQQYALTKKEWAIAEQLHEVLDVLRDATLLFSRKTPSLSTKWASTSSLTTSRTGAIRTRFGRPPDVSSTFFSGSISRIGLFRGLALGRDLEGVDGGA